MAVNLCKALKMQALLIRIAFLESNAIHYTATPYSERNQKFH